jgi:hypothetical protein
MFNAMIEERNTPNVGHDDPEWRTTTEFGPAITPRCCPNVVQCGLGKLSAQDKNWFWEHLVEFNYTEFVFLSPTFMTNGGVEEPELFQLPYETMFGLVVAVNRSTAT